MKPRNARHVVAFVAAFALAFFLAASPLWGQEASPAVAPIGEARFIVGVVGPARVTLDASWDDFDVEQVERAFCVRTWELTTGVLRGQPTVGLAVLEVEKPLWTGGATTNAISFRCKNGQPTIHTHPPTSCTADLSQCFIDRRQQSPETCGPSLQDRRYLNRYRAPFGVVQCGAGIFAFFFPAPSGSPPDGTSASTNIPGLPMGVRSFGLDSLDVQATHDLISLGSMIAGVVFAVSVITIRAHTERHHFYIGAVMVAWPDAPLWVRGVGFLILFDDAVQHAVQIKDPSYRSPVHKAYAVVLRWTGL